MANDIRLLSGRVKKTPATDADPGRYDFLDLQNAEPDLGVPTANGNPLVSNTDGTRDFAQVMELGTNQANVLGNLSVTGNITAQNFVGNITGNVDAGGANTQVQFNDGDILSGSTGFTFDKTANVVTVSGNVSAANLVSSGTVEATGNVQGGNIITAGSVDATGNVSGGNITTAGSVDATGNVSGGNITTAGSVDATGNVSGGNLVSAADVTTVTVSASGNVTAGNISTGGEITATGNVSGGNLTTIGEITATGNVSGGNVTTVGSVDATGNVSGGNITTAGQVNATGNVSGGNLVSAAGVSATTVTASGNISAGNLAVVQAITTSTLAASSTVQAANVLTNAVSGSAIVIYGTSVDFELTGNVDLSGRYIKSLANPVQSQDAATKQYVDDAVSSGIQIHDPVDVESPGPLPSATYAQGGNVFTVTDTIAGNTVVFSTAANLQVNDQLWFANSFQGIVGNLSYFVVSTPNTSAAILSTAYDGVPVSNITSASSLTESVRVNSGIGATLTATANGALIIDGFSVSAGNRALIYEQVLGLENGVYVVTDSGNATAPWILTRSSDADTYEPNTTTGLDDGSYFYVKYGNTGAGESYVKTAPSGPFIFGLANIVFTQFSASQVYSANTQAGIDLSGTVFSAKIDSDTTYFDPGGNIAVRPGANLVTPNIGDAVGNSLSLTGNGLLSAVTVDVSGNIQAGNVNSNAEITSITVTASGNISANNFVATNEVSAATVSAQGNVQANNIVSTNDVTAATGSFTGNVSVDTLLGNVQGTTANFTGNVTAANFIGNIDAGGTNTQVQFNDGDILAGSAGFTFDKTSNLVTVSGNISAANVTATTRVSAPTVAATTQVLTSNVQAGSSTQIDLYTTGAPNQDIYLGRSDGLGVTIQTPITTIDSGTSILLQGPTYVGSGTQAEIYTDKTSAKIFSDAGTVTGNLYLAATAVTIAATTGNTVVRNNLTAQGNVTGNNVVSNNAMTTQTLSASGNVSGGNLTTGGVVAATGNVSGGNVTTVGSVDATGNVSGGNITTVGQVSAGTALILGNITADTLLGNIQGTSADFTGNVTANYFIGNITGNIDAGGANTQVQFNDGDILAGSPAFTFDKTSNVVTVLGNVSATYFIGNGSQLTDIYANANVADFLANFGSNNITTTGNISGGNLTTQGQVDATGNIAGGNITTAGQVSATGNVLGGNINSNNDVSTVTVTASGNIQAGNVESLGSVDAVGNISANNVSAQNLIQGTAAVFTGNVSADTVLANVQGNTGSFTGNVTADYLLGNIDGATGSFTGNVIANTVLANIDGNTGSFTGNVQANWFLGNVDGGSAIFSGNVTAANFVGNVVGNITGNIDAGGANTQVQFNDGDILAGSPAFTFDKTSNVVTVLGNVSATYFIGNGSQLTGVYANANVADFLANFGSNNITTTGNISGGNLSATYEVSAATVAASGNVTGNNVSATNLVSAPTLEATANVQANNAVITNDVSAATATFSGNVTAGNIQSNVIAGTDITATGNISANNASVTNNLITGTLETTGNALIGGNLSIQGNLTYINVTDLRVEDPVIVLGTGANGNALTQDDGKDRGIYMEYYKAATQLGNAFVGWDNSTGNMIVASNTTILNDVVTVVEYGTLDAGNISVQSASISGNAVANNVQALSEISAPLVTANVSGTNASFSGNVAGGNITTVGIVDATGNVSGGNITTVGLVDATGNVSGGNLVSAADVTTATVSASGNVSGGNISTSGQMTATGNVSGGNVTTVGSVDATGNVSGGNITTPGEVSALTVMAVGNITANTLLGNVEGARADFTGNVTAANFIGNVQGNISGNINAGGANTQVQFNDDNVLAGSAGFTFDKVTNLVTVSGNVSAANLVSLGDVSATGNIAGGNVTTPGVVDATGNVSGGNITTSGEMVAVGNVSGGNIVSSNDVNTVTVTALGNVSGGNITTVGIVDATGNVSGGNITTAGSVDATGNVSGGNLVSAADVTTVTVSASGNVSGGNIVTGGVVSATGNVSGGNITTTGAVTALGNIEGGNLVSAADVTTVTVSASGNVSGGNITTVGSVDATGNVSGGNITTVGSVDATGNVSGGNVTTPGEVSATTVVAVGNVTGDTFLGNVQGTSADFTGNVTANYFIGNITGNIDAGGANTQVQFNDDDVLAGSSGFTFDKTANLVTVSGNVSAANLVSLGEVSATGNVSGGNITTVGSVDATGNVSGGNVTTVGSVDATGNVSGGNITTVGSVDATGNVSGGNLVSAADVTTVTVTATGNVSGGNITTVGAVDATGNVSGGNVITVGSVDATGNVSGGNLVTAGEVSGGTGRFTGNVQGETFLGNVDGTRADFTGNVTAANFTGNIDAGGANTEIQFNDNGILAGSSALTFDTTANIVTVQGNVSAFNFIGNVLATDIVISNNLSANNVNANLISSTGNVVGNNIVSNNDVTTDTVTASGNISSLGDVSSVTVTASGNIQGGNLVTAGEVSAGTITATGNITTSGFFVGTFSGNISGNLTAPGANTEIIFNQSGNAGASPAFVFDYNANVLSLTGQADISGNVQAGNLASNATVTTVTLSASGNIDAANVTASSTVTAANVSATYVTAGTVDTNAIQGTDVTITASNVDLVLTGNLDLGSRYINNVLNPQQAQDAATKQYVDDAVSSGIHVHPPVDVETTAALTSVTYANGGNTFTVNETIAGNTVVFTTAANLQVNDQLWFDNSFNGVVGNLAYFVVSTPNASAAVLTTAYNGVQVSNITSGSGLTEPVRVNSGVGATLTATANGAIVVDGVSLSAGNRVLVNDQLNQIENGVYEVTDTGNVTAPYILTRSSDTDTYEPQTSSGLDQGSYFYVESGSVGAGASYVKTAPAGPFIFGVANIEFTQFSASQVYSANTQAGLVLNGTVFSAKVNNDTTAFDGGGNISVKASANLVTPNIGNATGNSLTLTGNGLLSVTTIDVTGNVVANNILANSAVEAQSAIFSGNVSLGNLDVQGSIDAATVTATGNVLGNNLLATNDVSAVTVSASGNVTGDTFLGNVQGGTGVFSGNVTGDTFLGNVQGDTGVFTGNVSANYFLGNGSLLTGVSSSSDRIFNGLSEINIATANGNANVSINGTSNVVVFSDTGITVDGDVSTTGNVLALDFLGNGSQLSGINAFGTISVLNELDVVASTPSDTLTLEAGAGITITTDAANDTISIATFTTTFNSIFATGGNMGFTAQSVTSSDDLGILTNIANLGYSLGTIVVNGIVINDNILDGEITGNKFNPALEINTTGNITAGYFFGNGSQLTGVSSSSDRIFNGLSEINIATANGNANVSINGTSNVVVFSDTGVVVDGIVSATGNITANYFFGNGSQLTGISVSTNRIFNGTSEINIPDADGPANISIGGSANVVVIANTAVTMFGNVESRFATVTTSVANSQVTLDTWSGLDYRSARYYCQVTSGTDYEVIELSMVHDGANVYLTQYGQIVTNTSLGNFDASYAANSVSVSWTPVSAVTTVKASATLISV